MTTNTSDFVPHLQQSCQVCREQNCLILWGCLILPQQVLPLCCRTTIPNEFELSFFPWVWIGDDVTAAQSNQVSVSDTPPEIEDKSPYNVHLGLSHDSGEVGVAVECGKISIVNCQQAQRTTCGDDTMTCLLYTSPSPRDRQKSRMPSSA